MSRALFSKGLNTANKGLNTANNKIIVPWIYFGAEKKEDISFSMSRKFVSVESVTSLT